MDTPQTTTPEAPHNPALRRFGALVALAVLGADQIVKFIISGPLSLSSVRQIKLFDVFNLTWAQNEGVSFGLFAADSAAQRWLLVGLTALVAAIVAVWMWRERARTDVLALALVLGGALGNIIDRARLGYVIDYADLHFGEFRPFMIFNLADGAITIGVLLLVARALLVREKAA
ncbi:MAG: signal peptidase II [Sphingopyxis sp.]